MFSCFKGPRTEDQAQGVASPVPSSEGKSLPYWPQCRSQKLCSLQQQRIKTGNKDRTEWKVVAGDTSWGTSCVEQENCQYEAPSPFRNQNQHRATLNSCNFFGFYVVTCYLLVPVTRKKTAPASVPIMALLQPWKSNYTLSFSMHHWQSCQLRPQLQILYWWWYCEKQKGTQLDLQNPGYSVPRLYKFLFRKVIPLFIIWAELIMRP